MKQRSRKLDERKGGISKKATIEGKETSKILIVEDNEINIRIAKLFFEECGYSNILITRTGYQALKAFSSDIALVLLDFGLPDMKGIDVCREIRKKSLNKSLPIIGYTAQGDLNKEEWKQAGINDCLIKPILLSDFKSTIQRWLR